MVFNRSCFPKVKDFSMLGSPAGEPSIHRKSGSVKEMLLCATNRKYHLAYQFVPFLFFSSDLLQGLSNAI